MNRARRFRSSGWPTAGPRVLRRLARQLARRCARHGLLLPCAVTLLWAPFPAWAAAVPTLDQLFPAGFQLGTSNAAVAVGKFDPWPVRFWVDSPGVQITSATNSGGLQVQISRDVTPGPHLVRAWNEEGSSQPRFLIITAEAPVAEVEPNDQVTQPQRIENLPVWINGRLEKSGDVDCYSVHLDRSQTLIAALQAFVLGSPLDGVLRVTDSRGVQVGWNHDDGRTLDPFVAFTAPSAGEYVVQVFGFAYPADSDVRFTGNARCVYRLQLSRGPWVAYTLPMGVSRQGRTSLKLSGWNLAADALPAEFPGARIPADADTVWLTGLKTENRVSVPVGPGPEWMEKEPNDRPPEAALLEPPFAVTGIISSAGDEDRVAMRVKKGEVFRLEVRSASPQLDAWLKVETAAGKELQRSDDSSSGRDPSLVWTAGEEGRFVIAVGSLLHRGGEDYAYRLSVGHPEPSVTAKAADHSFTFEAGRTNELKVSVKLENGAKGKWTAALTGLPAEWTPPSQEVPEKSGDMSWKIPVAATAAAFSGSFQVILRSAETGQTRLATHDLIVVGENNGVPNGYNHLVIESIDTLWMTLKPAKAKPPADKK